MLPLVLAWLATSATFTAVLHHHLRTTGAPMHTYQTTINPHATFSEPKIEQLTLLERMAVHDDNEERRYLYEGRRVCIDWSWIWLSPSLGIGGHYSPVDDEVASAWINLGPLGLEIFLRRAR